MPANQPVIIVKRSAVTYAGGAWKVAYADFVTAMMAFFLLMWLLNATEADQLAGLADYFAPTIGVQGEKGIGFRGGKAALSDGIGADVNTNKGIVFGGVPSGPIIKSTEKIELNTETADAEKVIIFEGSAGEEDAEETEEIRFSYAKEQIEEELRAMQGPVGVQEAVDITTTIEGLQIEIKDSPNDSMFEEASPELKLWAKKVFDRIALVIRNLPNFVSITGHATEYYVQNKDSNYTIWELSADRANAARRYLLEQKVQIDRIFEVVGKGDNNPSDKLNPESPRNNRITILLLRDAVLPYHKQAIPDGLFGGQKAQPEVEQISEEPAEQVTP